MEIISNAELINLLLVLAAAAAGAGFMAGLLGVGGGIVMVPALYYAFTVLDFDIFAFLPNRNALLVFRHPSSSIFRSTFAAGPPLRAL